MRAALLSLVLLAGCASGTLEPDQPVGPVDLHLETLDGQELDLTGQPVALVYWQSW